MEKEKDELMETAYLGDRFSTFLHNSRKCEGFFSSFKYTISFILEISLVLDFDIEDVIYLICEVGSSTRPWNEPSFGKI